VSVEDGVEGVGEMSEFLCVD